MLLQSDHGDFAGLGHTKKHAFTDEGRADHNPKNPTGEPILKPSFKTVRDSCGVQLEVNLAQFWRDPGFVSGGTTVHDLLEGMVDARLEATGI